MKVVKCWSMSCPTEIMTSDSAKKIMTTFVFFFGTIHTPWKLLGRKKRKKKKKLVLGGTPLYETTDEKR